MCADHDRHLGNPDLPDVEGLLRRSGVVAAYLFGSRAKGMAGPLSDADLGVLFGSSCADPAEAVVGLLAELNGPDLPRVDVVDVTRTTPLLAHRAISGRLLFCSDEGARAAAETRVMRECMDTQHLRAMQDRAALRRLGA